MVCTNEYKMFSNLLKYNLKCITRKFEHLKNGSGGLELLLNICRVSIRGRLKVAVYEQYFQAFRN